VQLDAAGEGPVATVYKTGEPLFIPSAGEELKLKRREFAKEYGIKSICFIPFEDGVLEPQRGWTWNMCLSVGILHLIAGFTLLYYSTIQATLSKFKSSDDDEINTYVQSSLEISEINKTDTKTM